MFCTQCGKDVAEGCAVCPACGADVVAAVAEETAQEISAQHTADTEVLTATEETPVEEGTPKKKKRRFPIKWLITAVVAVTAVVALILNMDTIVGTVIKIFGSDTAYYRYVELNSFDDGVNLLCGYYGTAVESLNKENQKVDGTARIVVGDDLLELLEDKNVDIRFLNDLELAYAANTKDDATLVDLALSVAGGDPLMVSLMLDFAEGSAFFGVPSANDEYVQMDADFLEELGLPAIFAERLRDPAVAQELAAALPSERELRDLMDRYFTIVLDEVEVNAASETTLTIGEIQQSCTALDLDITGDVMGRVGNAVLNAARTDEELRGYIERLQTFLDEREWSEEVDLYASFSAWIDTERERVDDIADDAAGETVAAVTTYVSQTHKIIGRRIKTDGQEIFVATVQKGGKYATEVNVNDHVTVIGSGARHGSVLEGAYELQVDGVKMMEITLSDFDMWRAAGGHLNGSIRLTPKKALFEHFGIESEEASTASFMNLSLELQFQNSKSERRCEVNILKDEKVLLGLALDSHIGRSETVELPEEAVEITETDELKEWFESFEGDTVLDKLENAGMPKEITDFLALYMVFIP